MKKYIYIFYTVKQYLIITIVFLKPQCIPHFASKSIFYLHEDAEAVYSIYENLQHFKEKLGDLFFNDFCLLFSLICSHWRGTPLFRRPQACGVAKNGDTRGGISWCHPFWYTSRLQKVIFQR